MNLNDMASKANELYTTPNPVSEGRVSEYLPVLHFHGDNFKTPADVMTQYRGMAFEHPLDRGRQPIESVLRIMQGKKKIATWRRVNGVYFEQVTQVQKVIYDYPSIKSALMVMSCSQQSNFNPSSSMRFGMTLVGFIIGVDGPVIKRELLRFLQILVKFSKRLTIEDERVIINFS